MSNPLAFVQTREEPLPNELVEQSIPSERIKEAVVQSSQHDTNQTDFYLYRDLMKQATSKTNKLRLDSDEIDELLRGIKQLDHEGHKILFVLIRMHSMQNNNAKLFDLPYSAKKLREFKEESDFEFDLRNIPNTLQRMLLLFCRMHMEHMKTNNARHSFHTAW